MYRPGSEFQPFDQPHPGATINLEVGEKAELTAAWLRFPSFKLEPLPQSYERLEEAALPI